MNQRPIRDAMADAELAIENLEHALKLVYCATFKGHISNAIYRLECAAKTLREMKKDTQ